jgi:hypothetical protein
MKIFITGCAKTGTTLVRRLFNAFDLKVCNHKEIKLSDFINSEYDVGKRDPRTVYSYSLAHTKRRMQLDLIKENDIRIVNVTRGRKATLASSNKYVTPHRYGACIADMVNYPEYIDCLVRYEELVKNPDAVQTYVSEVLGLTPVHKWSDYPKFIDPTQEPRLAKNYDLRPIQ